MDTSHILYTDFMWNSLKKNPVQKEHIARCIHTIQTQYMQGTIPFLSLEHVKELPLVISSFLQMCGDAKNLIIVGIGGSSVGIKALVQLLYPEQDFPSSPKKIFFAENLDEEYMEELQKALNPKESIVLAISKSGNTIETVSQYLLLKTWLASVYADTWYTRMAVITDSCTGFLYQEVQKYSLFYATIPENLGGRYSIVSAIGALPLAFLGFDALAFLSGAKEYAHRIYASLTTVEKNPLWEMALWQYMAEMQGYTQTIFFSYIPRSAQLGAWLLQLWAESLGKKGRGTFPIFAQGAIDQHSLQQMFLDGKKNATCIFLHILPQKKKDSLLPLEQYSSSTLITTTSPERSYIHNKSLNDILFAEYEGTCSAFVKEHIPHCEYALPTLTEYSIGGAFVFFQSLVFLLGTLLEINPLDQPAVEYGKEKTKEILQNNTTTSRHSAYTLP